jgi:hypothetical protein
MLSRRILFWLLLCVVPVAAQERALPSTSSRSRLVSRLAATQNASQSIRAKRIVQPLSAVPSLGTLPGRPQAVGTLRILALMVDFQPSDDLQVNGNGQFETDTTGSWNMIDPPPHDVNYFTYKLLFLSNYFRKVSNGKLTVTGDVFNHIITLPNTLADYSPPKGSSDNSKLAQLVIDSWHTADSLYPSIQFSKYDAFALFHAGVGRDIDLVGILGYDPTPNDIPSVTVNLQTLRSYLNDPTFKGVPVNNGSFYITNTMILPETESRFVFSSSSVDTLQGSINGLLANSVGSILGLPDLFDTQNGGSGIGDYGLMDIAAGILFYSGLFPPEPSAWEKIYLGWATPITLPPGTSPLSVPAVGLTTVGEDTIYKVPISDREYFLIENRSRDPQGNGQRLTVRKGNSTITQYFAGDGAGFNLNDISGVAGSVIDVEDFDWAMPGITGGDNTVVGGGILIWHIDENVIARGLQDNTVNADPTHRGVDLEEADGSNDIGQPLTYGDEYGSPLDCWFDGNLAPPYKNAFDEGTYPSSNAYDGARSMVTIGDFSARSPRMTLTVEIGDEKIQRIQGFKRTLASDGRATPPTILGSTILVGANDSVYAFQPDGASATQESTGLLSPKGGAYSLAATDLGSGSTMIVGAQDSSLYIWTVRDVDGDGVIDSVQTIVVPLGDRVSTPPMFADVSLARAILVGGDHGSVWQVSTAGVVQNKMSLSSDGIVSIAQLPTPGLSKPSELFFATRGSLFSEQVSVSPGDSSYPWMLAGGVSDLGNFVAAAQQGGTRLVVYNRTLTDKIFEFTVPGDSILALGVGAVDRDGGSDVVLLTKAKLYAFNPSGAIVPGYPVVATGGNTFVGFFLVGDISGDGSRDILAVESSGALVAYDGEGRLIDGFPVQYGVAGETLPGLFRTTGGKIGIVGVTEPGALQAVEVNETYDPTTIGWSQFLKDAGHAGNDGSGISRISPPSDFLPASRVYNWPNPVYGSTTQIRYYTPEAATIRIKIFDLAGAKVAELQGRSIGGVDGEVTWDVSNVQSGVYLARIEASGTSRTQVAIIKIAIVK